MKYDDASWHYGGEFPNDLTDEAAATHIGMFLAWCVLNGLAGDIHANDLAEDLEKLRTRTLTPGKWFINACDAKFFDEDVTAEGNAFIASYYAPDQPQYVVDYEETVAQGLASLYHVPDTWQTYDLLAPVISKRYEDWKRLKT